MSCRKMFKTGSGDDVVAFTIELAKRGAAGAVACALFRAFNNSFRAKKGRKQRRERYDRKGDALKSLCTSLVEFNPRLHFKWGWGRDEGTRGYSDVLYVDIPTGQVSFHSAGRYQGPRYKGRWDGSKESRERIADWCDQLLLLPTADYDLEAMPFGKWCGVPLSLVDEGYFDWIEERSEFSDELKELIRHGRLLQESS